MNTWTEASQGAPDAESNVLNCLNCGFENPADARFCVACGTPLPRLCGSCGEVNPARFRFCGACGSSLSIENTAERPAGVAAPSPGATLEPEAPVPADPERRHLTVMFCDLVGSTALSLTLDPEELREVVRSYQDVCAGAIEQFGGYIAQYLGDGVLVYFGFPVALEDEADRAVGAGLEIIEAIEALNHRLKLTHGVALAVRVGIHTGVVVVGEVGTGARREHLALGDTPNIAARLQSVATPDSVVVSSETYRLVARSFECEELGAHGIKGVPPEPIYRVLRERRLPVVEPGTNGRASSLLGREHELSLLLDRWEQVRNGKGRVVCISGDPGIGKSHLVHELKARMGAAAARMDTRCLPYYRNTAFHPFIDLLQRELSSSPDQTPHERLQALARLAGRDGLAADEAVPLFASLLSVRSGYARPLDPPPLQKEKTKAALVQLLLRSAAEQPVVLTVEDLHWADPSTLEVLDQLMPHVATGRLLVLFTFRPEFGVRWASHAHVTHIYIGRLNRRQAEALVAEVARCKPLPAEVVNQIIARTDGVPLFIEELTRMLLESGLLEEREDRYELNGPLPPVAIPTTLRDSLEARLDRLPAVKEIALLGATIGREFTYALLAAVANTPDDALRDALAELADAGLLYARGNPPDATYAFKHGMIQEAAYQSLLRSTRQRYHQRIAVALDERFPEIAEAHPELLALHYTAAGLTTPAVQAWRRAGQRALERSAYTEAVAHLTQGLELLEPVPDSDERAVEELELLCTLAPALAATRGYTAVEVRDVCLRARALCERLDRPSALAQVLVGLFAYQFVRAELRSAAATAQELLRLAERTDDPTVRLCAHAAIGVCSLAAGELAAAHEHLDALIRMYDPAEHAALAVLFGQDFGVVGLAYSGWLLWITGCPDQAQARVRDALALAERLRHPHSSALALSIGAAVHLLSRDVAGVRELAGRLHELAAAQGFKHWVIEARLLLAWVAAEQGHLEQALAAMEAEIALLRAHGSLMPYHYYFRTMAELHGRLGRPERGREVIKALNEMLDEAHQGWWWESEVHRVDAELMLMLDEDDPAAEDGFQRALEVARTRRARSLELRAALGLVRLWRRRGRTSDARALLADCYEGFTEGFDTLDLRETRALLQELERAVVV